MLAQLCHQPVLPSTLFNLTVHACCHQHIGLFILCLFHNLCSQFHTERYEKDEEEDEDEEDMKVEGTEEKGGGHDKRQTTNS